MQFIDLTLIAAAAALIAGSAQAQTAVVTPVAASRTAASATGKLTVTFSGMEAKQGAIMLAIYDEAGWSGGKPIRAEMLDASSGNVSASITDLPVGRYGVKAFHDGNGNGKMDTNPFGMPTEPFAFSNNAQGAHGPATWTAASFTVAPGSNAQAITIR